MTARVVTYTLDPFYAFDVDENCFTGTNTHIPEIPEIPAEPPMEGFGEDGIPLGNLPQTDAVPSVVDPTMTAGLMAIAAALAGASRLTRRNKRKNRI